MATSGITTFNLEIHEIVEEAFERCGLDLATAYDLRSARRSLNLLLLEWANTGVNLWRLEKDTLSLIDDAHEYALDSDTIDILDAVISDSTNTDIPAERISIEEWLSYPKKDTEGWPTQYAVQKGSDALKIFVYPEPNASYTFTFWKIRYIEDVGVYSNNPNVPRRFLPALVAGLAHHIAQKNPARRVSDPSGQAAELDGVGREHRLELAQEYERLFQQAREEDRSRSSLWLLPKGRRW